MITDKLKSDSYYQNKLTMFTQEDNNIFLQNQILINFVKDCDNAIDGIFKGLDIFSSTYQKEGENYIYDYSETSTEYNILDSLAKYYGLSRKYSYKHGNNFSVDTNTFENYTYVSKKLTNKELILLVQLNIIKNNFNGTVGDLICLYQKAGINLYISNGSQQVNMFLVSETTEGEASFLEDLFIYTNLFELTYGFTYNKKIKRP